MTQIFIVSGTSWTVPPDWNSADNTIETIGGGGGGGTATGGNDAGGGGGGAYSRITNLSLIPGTNITIQVGKGGAANTAGGDTWFNGASLPASSVGAKGGAAASGITGGLGGQASGGIGATVYSGGDGGSSNNAQSGGAGGGGAAGPNGAGQPAATSRGEYGSGGGGASGGSATAGSDGSGTTGGAGGTAQDGSDGGAGGVAGGAAATSGTHGAGGGGGAADAGNPTTCTAASGSNGIEFDDSHGAGGGGGGAGNPGDGFDVSGGGGGLYGGGGGATAFRHGAGVGGAGAQGIIVITYTPTARTTITTGSLGALEFPTTGRRDGVPLMEFSFNALSGSRQPLEARGRMLRSVATPNEYACVALRVTALSTEGLGVIAVTTNALLPLEVVLLRCSDTIAQTELGLRTLGRANGSGEWLAMRTVDPGVTVEDFANVWADFDSHSESAGRLVGQVGAPIEIIAALRQEARPVLESLTAGARIVVAGLLGLEWADPPALMVVSPERVLRSPGRIRILAGPGSMHPLRGQ